MSWNTSTASAPVDDPMQIAMDAIDCDPAKLRECAIRVIGSGEFDDDLMDVFKPSTYSHRYRSLIGAVRLEVERQAAENIQCAKEARRECMEDR